MTRRFTFLFLIFAINLTFAQSQKNWTELDYLNTNSSYPFQTENDITGMFFVTISDTFDYYNKPIILKNSEDEEIINIQFTDHDIITIFNNKEYSSKDTLNPLNPWLISFNPDGKLPHISDSLKILNLNC